MPVRRTGEAHQALELLEEYHASLTRPSDEELRTAIERVISVFKDRLFLALLDIQEFYEDTLVNDRKTQTQKTFETKRMAEQWENNPPFGVRRPPLATEEPGLTGGLSGGLTGLSSGLTSGLSFIDANNRNGNSYTTTTSTTFNRQIETSQRTFQMTSDSWQNQDAIASKPQTPTAISASNGASGEHWEYDDVVLEKGHTGLGFSITGGTDQPYIGTDPSIYVTKIIPGGAAANDGRLNKDDIILKVNQTDCVNVPHEVAVTALKNAGNVVKLHVKRRVGVSPDPPSVIGAPPSYAPPPPPSHQAPPVATSLPRQSPTPLRSDLHMNTQSWNTVPIHTQPMSAVERLEREPGVQKIVLVKGFKGLGFSIAGGIGNEHVAGDVGIYVTKIIEGGAADLDGRLRVGDKLLAVDHTSLDAVTHEDAVNTLKATSTQVTLLYIKNPHPELLNQSQDSSLHQTTPQPFTYTQPITPVNPMPPFTPSRIGPPQSFPQPVDPVTQVGRSPRQVTLHKGPQGLGFNIVGGEDGEPVYISYVLPGGAADLSGSVFKGDALLQVNNVNLRGATHNDAAQALKNANGNVNLVLQHRPEDYQRFETKIDQLRNEMINQTGPPAPSPRRELYVRALFDNDPSKDGALPQQGRGLAFNYGDILHVTNANDDDWWTARRINADGQDEGQGIIPSKRRVEKRERARRKQVNFNAGSQSLGRSGGLEGRRGSRSQLSFSRKFPFMKSKERLNDETEGEFSAGDEPILSYEAVEQQELHYVRPVIILGALKDRINDELVTRNPERFGSCVPHTSRPPRDNEMSGRDYHFVTREQMEIEVQNNQFIEAGQYMGNLYGTSINSVRQVSQQNKHCILDVSGNAIRRLQSAGLYPIAVFVKPYEPRQFMEWDRHISEDEAQKQFQRTQMVEQEFGEAFTAIVQGYTPEEISAKVRNVIADQSRPIVWVPSREPLI